MPSSSVISEDFQKITLSPDTDEVTVWLIEMHHPSLEEPVRLSSDKTELLFYHEENGEPIYGTRHQGHMYLEGSFGVVAPGNPEDGSPSAKFVFAATDEVKAILRNVHGAVQLVEKIVLAGDPDTVIAEYSGLWLQNIDYDSAQIEATLGFNHFLDEPCGRLLYLPSIFSGLFKNGVIVE